MNAIQVRNAVEVRHASKHYGKKNDQKIVLSNLNMTVSKGSMYVEIFSPKNQVLISYFSTVMHYWAQVDVEKQLFSLASLE